MYVSIISNKMGIGKQQQQQQQEQEEQEHCS